MPSIYSRLGIHEPFDPQCLYVTSPILPPLALAFVRLLLATYILISVTYMLVIDTVQFHIGSSFFSYFTRLSWIGVMAYLFAGGVQTLFYALNLRRRFAASQRSLVDSKRTPRTSDASTRTAPAPPPAYPLQAWPRPLQLAHVLLWATVTTYPLITTIVFWSLLSGAGTFDSTFNTWGNISGHAMNTLFALLEIGGTNSPPPPWALLPLLVLMLGGYLGVAYITHATQGVYVYDFLDPAKEHAKLAMYIVGIAVGCVVLFSVSHGLILLRQRICRRRVEPVAGPEQLDEWDLVEPEPKPEIGSAV